MSGPEDAPSTVPLGDAPDLFESIEEHRRREELRAKLFGSPPEPLTIGRFVPIARLGKGGMGVVYVAYDPELDRKVALKLLHRSSEGDALLAREAKIMAKLAHPNVVTVYDVGERQGRLFLAMELVDGVTLRAFLSEQERTTAEILDVLTQAGRGLAAAHALGVIHRDFKPDNVMVGRDGRARVLDFGLARPGGEGRAPDAPEGDHKTAIAGTPAYMAPEQLAGKALDARADQFAFAVSLFEALHGRRPFEGSTIDDLQRAIAEGPPRGSRAIHPAIDAAIARALACDRGARWPSMDALLDEIGRDRGARRRRILAVAAAAIVTAIAAFAAWSIGRAPREAMCSGGAKLAEEVWSRAKKDEVKRAILASGRAYAGETWPRVEERLDRYAATWAVTHDRACREHARGDTSADLYDRLTACLAARRTELGAIASVLADGGDVVENAVRAVSGLSAIERCTDVERLRAEVPPPSDPAAAREVTRLRDELAKARVERNAGRYDRSRDVIMKVVAEAARLGYAPLDAEALFERGMTESTRDEFEAAITSFEDAHARAVEARSDRVAADAAIELFFVIGYRQGKLDASKPWERTAGAFVKRLGDPVMEADFLDYRGVLRTERAAYADARADLERALALREASLGPRALNVGVSLINVGRVYFLMGEKELDQKVTARALAIDEEALGPNHPEIARSLSNHANGLIELGKYAEAVSQLARARAIEDGAFGPDSLRSVPTRITLSIALNELGRRAEALAQLERARAILEAEAAPKKIMLAMVLSNIGSTLTALKRPAEGIPALERSVALREAELGPNHPKVAVSLANVGEALAEEGKLDEAKARFERALAIDEKTVGPNHPNTAAALAGLARIALAKNDARAAEKLAARAIAIHEAASSPPLDRAAARMLHAKALAALGDRDRARPIALAVAADYEAAGPGYREEAQGARAFVATLGPAK